MAREIQMVGNGDSAAQNELVQLVDAEVDDDGRPKRTGTVSTASAHIITAVIGSGVLSLAWATAQLGWFVGPGSLVIFSAITFYTSNLLADCYRTGDPITGKRNYSYVEAVKSSLGKKQVWLCLICQYTNLYWTSVGYIITAAISAGDMHKSLCLHKRTHAADCKISDSRYMIAFGILQIFMSQLPNFHDLWIVSILAAIMSFLYSSIVVGLSIARVVSGGIQRTTLTGTQVGVDLDASQKIWLVLQALGNIAFAYSFSMILVEIQDTLKSTPPENKTMKKAVLISLSITTAFYLLCGCLGYAAFGNSVPGNILTGFSPYEPLWIVSFAHACIIVHLAGAYQVFSQPIFSMVESYLAKWYPNLISSKPLEIRNKFKIKMNFFMIVWRTMFVVTTTVLAIVMPFFNDIVGFLGAVAFWPLTVYFPIEMYIKSRRIRVLSAKWIWLQSLSAVCFIISVASACASVQGIAKSLKSYTPFEGLS
ncbi:Amino acid permease 1 [Rhynchospora pubera]|uniref:Amino acid permease 1 n=1 Tax=Rhynchospora pubera TaxID=906938 RepID=A0AAV8F9R6_9POAL|nr:Amino acid permease 1 [Rhynchospora pubera]KAJ4808555.1 Amino acid permease 1 [Rhynchospora pubera]